MTTVLAIVLGLFPTPIYDAVARLPRRSLDGGHPGVELTAAGGLKSPALQRPNSIPGVRWRIPSATSALLDELLSDDARLLVVSNRGPVTLSSAPGASQANDLDDGGRGPFDAADAHGVARLGRPR